MSIKLHIGCADQKLNGFVNIDVRKTTATDLVTRAWELSSFKENSVDLIYSRHMFEHLDPNDGVITLKEWYRVLKPSGTVNIVVPDLEFHCRQLLERKHDAGQLRHALAGFYGWRDESRGGSRHDDHKWGYIKETLEEIMINTGFKHIERKLTGADTSAPHLNITATK